MNLTGDTLTIRGERKQDKERKSSVHRVERIYGSFERSFTFNTPVKNEGDQARYRDGVLEVRGAEGRRGQGSRDRSPGRIVSFN